MDKRKLEDLRRRLTEWLEAIERAVGIAPEPEPVRVPVRRPQQPRR